MNRQLPILILTLLLIIPLTLSAQPLTPDTTTMKVRKNIWHNCIITWKDGKQTSAYMHFPVVQGNGEWYYVPANTPKAKRQKVEAKKIRYLTFSQSRYEVIENAKHNRWRLCQEAIVGKVSLYTYTEQKSLPIPVPVLPVTASIPYQSSLFYLKRNGEFLEVEKTKFVEQMSEYFQDNPTIVAKIQDKTFRYHDMVTLVNEYNATQKAEKEATPTGD